MTIETVFVTNGTISVPLIIWYVLADDAVCRVPTLCPTPSSSASKLDHSQVLEQNQAEQL